MRFGSFIKKVPLFSEPVSSAKLEFVLTEAVRETPGKTRPRIRRIDKVAFVPQRSRRFSSPKGRGQRISSEAGLREICEKALPEAYPSFACDHRRR